MLSYYPLKINSLKTGNFDWLFIVRRRFSIIVGVYIIISINILCYALNGQLHQRFRLSILNHIQHIINHQAGQIDFTCIKTQVLKATSAIDKASVVSYAWRAKLTHHCNCFDFFAQQKGITQSQLWYTVCSEIDMSIDSFSKDAIASMSSLADTNSAYTSAVVSPASHLPLSLPTLIISDSYNRLVLILVSLDFRYIGGHRIQSTLRWSDVDVTPTDAEYAKLKPFGSCVLYQLWTLSMYCD